MSAVLAVLAVGSGCSAAPQATAPRAGLASVSGAPSVSVTTVRQFDPQWMGLAAPPTWTEVNRRITGEFQQFGLRPAGEKEMPSGCNGCGVDPPTAYLTVHTAGKFDPTEANAAEPVTVKSANDGFFSEAGDSAELLTWQYGDNAWASIRGTTTMTRQQDRMLELAQALRPGELTAIRAPLSMPEMPKTLSLAEITVDRGRYGTTLEFAPCGKTETGATDYCGREGDYLRVQIWPEGTPEGYVSEQGATAGRIGGRDGIYQADGKSAAVQVRPGMVVVFALDSDSVASPPLTDILATLAWASDPADPQNWPPVADWSKQD